MIFRIFHDFSSIRSAIFLNGPCNSYDGLAIWEKEKRERVVYSNQLSSACVPESWSKYFWFAVLLVFASFFSFQMKSWKECAFSDRDFNFVTRLLITKNTSFQVFLFFRRKRTWKMKTEDKMSENDKSILNMGTLKQVEMHNKGERVCAS